MSDYWEISSLSDGSFLLSGSILSIYLHICMIVYLLVYLSFLCLYVNICMFASSCPLVHMNMEFESTDLTIVLRHWHTCAISIDTLDTHMIYLLTHLTHIWYMCVSARSLPGQQTGDVTDCVSRWCDDVTAGSTYRVSTKSGYMGDFINYNADRSTCTFIEFTWIDQRPTHLYLVIMH